MKICEIIYAYSPYPFGGADIWVEKMSKAIAKRNHQSVIITVNPIKGDRVERVDDTKIYRFYPFNITTVHNIGVKSIFAQGAWSLLDIYSFYSYKKIITILKKENPDIVHIHTPFDVTLSAVSAAKSLNLPIVYTLHDYFLLCRRIVLLHASGEICTEKNVNFLCKIYRKFTRKIVDDVDIVVAPSKFVLDMHKKNGFFKNAKTIISTYGIELNSNDLNRTSINKSELKTFNILYCGGLTKHKGVSILITAFKQINNGNVRLHIVGGGIYKNELKRLASSDDRIIFHGEYSNENVQEFYKRVNVCVVPSLWYEVLGIVIQEAFKAAVPVIASRIGGITEIVEANYNGFLFEPGNIVQLKEILEYCIKNPQKLKELGQNAKLSVQKYEMSTYIDYLIKIYEEAIKNKQT